MSAILAALLGHGLGLYLEKTGVISLEKWKSVNWGKCFLIAAIVLFVAFEFLKRKYPLSDPPQCGDSYAVTPDCIRTQGKPSE